jgi:2-keto-4-pentenoate hydratase/2-oxohepta-3-ene-1,7-dioic acid hydratase in catechol pathway
LVAEISAVCTLNPGDLIMTGTPAGCGAFRRPPAGLAAGDVVKLEIDGIGAIENRIVDEPLTA